MPPYTPQQNPSGLFQLFKGDNKDRLSCAMQQVGKVAFGVCFGCLLALKLFYSHSKATPAHDAPLAVLIAGAAGGFFVGLFMFIGVGARTMGQANGINGFGHQILNVIWKTFLYLILPCLILSLIVVLLSYHR